MPMRPCPIIQGQLLRSVAPAAILMAVSTAVLFPASTRGMQSEPEGDPPLAEPAGTPDATDEPVPWSDTDGEPVRFVEPPPPTSTDPVETEVTFRDGRTITGEFVRKDSTKIWLRIAGIETPLSLSDVDRVVQLPSVEARYEQLRKSIEPNDAPGLVRLSQWLLARKRYALALLEVDRALEVDPHDAVALQHRTLVLESARIADAAKSANPDDPAGAVRERPAGQAREEWPLLTPAQINLIRVYEVDLKDPPRIFITRDAINRFMDAYGGQGSIPVTKEGREAFLRLRPSRQLEAMFSVRAREFYSEVRIADNPEPFKRLRDDVLRGWLINSCATTQCHGGTQAGRLQLIPIRPGSDDAVYTNFIIMDRFRTRDGMPLIDYSQPARSPLLHMALDPRVSLFQHPATEGPKRWQPVFRNERDDRFQRTVSWIRSMFQPRPDYPIEYTPPGESVAPSAEPQPR